MCCTGLLEREGSSRLWELQLLWPGLAWCSAQHPAELLPAGICLCVWAGDEARRSSSVTQQVPRSVADPGLVHSHIWGVQTDPHPVGRGFCGGRAWWGTPYPSPGGLPLPLHLQPPGRSQQREERGYVGAEFLLSCQLVFPSCGKYKS